MIDKIVHIIERNPAVSWTISSSPRTPEDACRLLDDVAAGQEEVLFFRSSNTPAGWVEEQYALNAKVWVTADSMSMIYEALAAGCSVEILPVQWKQQRNKFQTSIDLLAAKELVIEYDKWLAGAPMKPQPQEPLNDAHRCAEEILRRWWPDRLP